jgi:hypothetical protein
VICHDQRRKAGGRFNDLPYLTGKPLELFDAFDISMKKDHPGGRGLGKYLTLLWRQFSAGQARYENRGELPVNIADRTWHQKISMDYFRLRA